MKRSGYWFVLTGLVIGALAGLAYAWVADPVVFTETAPFMMGEEARDQYRILVASAFTASGDLGRAEARLAQIRDSDAQQALAAQAQRIVAAQGSYADARALALLAAAISQAGQTGTAIPALATPTLTETAVGTLQAEGTPALPSTSPTAGPTRRPTATKIPTATPGQPFVAADSGQVCREGTTPSLLTVKVVDASGRPVPGVQVIVSWAGGEDIFYTGLKPEFGMGYADFQMTEGVEYTLRLAEGGQPVSGISVPMCPGGEGEADFSGGWEVLFSQP